MGVKSPSFRTIKVFYYVRLRHTISKLNEISTAARSRFAVMYVEVYVRHSSNCPHKANRYYKKCRCRKWLAIAGRTNACLP